MLIYTCSCSATVPALLDAAQNSFVILCYESFIALGVSLFLFSCFYDFKSFVVYFVYL